MCREKREGGMGFRDLQAFNLAMLAKQGLRMLEEPSSLMARFYKAKYFQTTMFLGRVLEVTHLMCGEVFTKAWRFLSKALGGEWGMVN